MCSYQSSATLGLLVKVFCSSSVFSACWLGRDHNSVFDSRGRCLPDYRILLSSYYFFNSCGDTPKLLKLPLVQYFSCWFFRFSSKLTSPISFSKKLHVYVNRRVNFPTVLEALTAVSRFEALTAISRFEAQPAISPKPPPPKLRSRSSQANSDLLHSCISNPIFTVLCSSEPRNSTAVLIVDASGTTPDWRTNLVASPDKTMTVKVGVVSMEWAVYCAWALCIVSFPVGFGQTFNPAWFQFTSHILHFSFNFRYLRPLSPTIGYGSGTLSQWFLPVNSLQCDHKNRRSFDVPSRCYSVLSNRILVASPFSSHLLHNTNQIYSGKESLAPQKMVLLPCFLTLLLGCINVGSQSDHSLLIVAIG